MYYLDQFTRVDGPRSIIRAYCYEARNRSYQNCATARVHSEENGLDGGPSFPTVSNLPTGDRESVASRLQHFRQGTESSRPGTGREEERCNCSSEVTCVSRETNFLSLSQARFPIKHQDKFTHAL